MNPEEFYATFRPGERVQYTNNTPISPDREGMIGTVVEQTRVSNVQVQFDGDVELGCFPENLVRIAKSAKRPLVGPAPKVEAPHYVAPFEAKGSLIFDAKNNIVLSVSVRIGGPDAVQRREFAVYIAEALNARASEEE